MLRSGGSGTTVWDAVGNEYLKFSSPRVNTDILAGAVWINGHSPIVRGMPHGDVKQSGFGKDTSLCSLNEHTTIKRIAMDRTGNAEQPWHRTLFAG